jgi:hypothetical protein
MQRNSSIIGAHLVMCSVNVLLQAVVHKANISVLSELSAASCSAQGQHQCAA